MEDVNSKIDTQQFPVSLLTGFLGSGKTTVLNHLLRAPELANTLVIINEFGEIGLDHELVEWSNGDMVLLQSGCLCCTIRGDLVDTLRSVFLRRVKGEIPEFDRVLIETTGLADPAPILHTLMTDLFIGTRYRLDGVITTVDAVNGQDTLDRQEESVKQAAMADRLLLTKTDLAETAAIEALERRLRALNPAAPILRATDGIVSPGKLLDAGLYNPKTKSLDVQRWLNVEAYSNGDHHSHDADHGHDGHQHDHGHHHDHGHSGHDHAHSGHDHHHHHHDVNRHDDNIRAVCLTIDDPIPGDALDAWLETLMRLRGPDLLRIKGMVNIVGLKGPFVFHAVQHIFHPPVMLKKWPGKDRRSRIVFITRGLDEVGLRSALRMFVPDSPPQNTVGTPQQAEAVEAESAV